jgi:hypothetical protein
MSKWIEIFKEKVKEKEGRKGLVPWLSLTIQKWVLIVVIYFSSMGTIMSIAQKAYFPSVLFAAIAIFSFYVGFKTKWLNSIDETNKPIKQGGAIVIGIGTLAIVMFLAIAVFWILVAIFVLLGFLGKGNTIIKQDGKTYHQNVMGDWNPEKDWMGNDKVDRDLLGNPKIETDWKGDQIIERDWKGDPIITPEK